MCNNLKAVADINDASNWTLHALDLIEGCVLVALNNMVEGQDGTYLHSILDYVQDARKAQLDIKALF